MISSSLAQDYLIPGDLGSLDFDHIHPEGFPPSARFSGGACSIHLSYSPNGVLVMIMRLLPAINSAAAMMWFSPIMERKTSIFTEKLGLKPRASTCWCHSLPVSWDAFKDLLTSPLPPYLPYNHLYVCISLALPRAFAS